MPRIQRVEENDKRYWKRETEYCEMPEVSPEGFPRNLWLEKKRGSRVNLRLKSWSFLLDF
jgi:hypothetical protein